MAKNLVMKEGRYQEWAVAAKSSGDPVIKGLMTGVCLTDTNAAGNVSVDMGGVYDLSVKAVDDAGNSAVAVGDQLFYVVGDTPLLSKKRSGLFFGFALEAVLSGETVTIKVLQIPGPGPGTVDIPAGAIGTSELADGAVTSAKLAGGAGLAAAIAAGLGASAAYPKTTTGAQTLLAADAAARVALILVVVDEEFADGDGAQSVFTIGETDAANKFMANTVCVAAAAGTVFLCAGTLTATKALLVTGTAATGTGTGGISVTALVLDAAP